MVAALASPSPRAGEGRAPASPSPRAGEGRGGGSALRIRTWYEAEALLKEVSFTIFNRPDTSIALSTLHELGFSPARTRLVHLDTPAIAAHQVRDRLRRGTPIDDLVPPGVADYIRAHALYQA